MDFKILLLLAITLSVGSFSSYNVGYSQGTYAGNLTGYTQGLILGNETGYLSGYEKGYSLGYLTGNVTGYSAGYSDGNRTGYSLGYSIGHNSGYSVGYSVGYEEGYSRGNSSGYSLGREAGYLQGVIDGAGRGYNIRDPTYNEALSFIKEDKTDLKEYTDTYQCRHFAAEVKNNAFLRGYRCAYVIIGFPGGSHAIVAFNTTDKGMVFIEPQDDEIVNVKIGQPYFDRTKYEPPSLNDTIVEVIIMW